MTMMTRMLTLPKPPHSFFLWGPRLSGKTTLLRQHYPRALWYDLLQSDVFLRLASAPHVLREEVLAHARLARGGQQIVIIDEVQKIPALLDEVHWLIEHTRLQFVLSGSSARKLRRGHANLLGGRAQRIELMPLVSAEVPEFDLVRALNQGLLPRHYLSDQPAADQRAYVADYLREEIAAEALLRSLPTFARFLEAAAIGNGQCLAYANIARECGVSAPTVRAYYEILEDTLLGAPLPPYRLRPKRRVIVAPKWYFFDPAIAGCLARRGVVMQGSAMFGHAFEHFIHHELRAYAAYSGKHFDIAYWRTAGGAEVDFILGRHEAAIEVKATTHAHDQHARGLVAIGADYTCGQRLLVTLDPRPRLLSCGIMVLPWREFCARLWAGEVV